MSDQVHWNEGLFLQPHHLQAMQRRILDRFISERKLGWPFPFGVIETKLSPDALENHSVRFTRLSAVMPSGLEVNLPEDTDLSPLNIKQMFESSPDPFIVYLGVPLWQSDRPNTIERGAGDDWRPKRMFRISEAQLNDENTGTNPQPVQLRRTNGRLLLAGDDQTDLEVLPLMRIIRATRQEAGLPQQDPNFVPPCMLLSGSVVLRAMIRDLANQVDASRKDLVSQMTREKFNADAMQAAQFEQVLRLRTLSRYSHSLANMVEAAAITPFELYIELGRLLGELSALKPDAPADVAPYDHLNPAVAFQELNNRIRPHLRPKGEVRVMEVPFVTVEGGTRVAAVRDEHLTLPNEYFLGVKSREDPRAVTTLVEDADRFKLTTRKLVGRGVFRVEASGRAPTARDAPFPRRTDVLPHLPHRSQRKGVGGSEKGKRVCRAMGGHGIVGFSTDALHDPSRRGAAKGLKPWESFVDAVSGRVFFQSRGAAGTPL